MNFIFHGIDHIQLAAPAGCEEKARAFFGGILGWQELVKPAALQQRGGVWFQCGKHQVHIGVDPYFTPAAKAHPAFLVSGLAQLRIHLMTNGHSVIDDAARSEDGLTRFFTQDPFGNRLEFLEYC